MTLIDIMEKGMNNPDCAYFVGQSMGSAQTTQNVLMIFAIYILLRFIEKLAVDPIIQWIKIKIWKPIAKTEG